MAPASIWAVDETLGGMSGEGVGNFAGKYHKAEKVLGVVNFEQALFSKSFRV
jgi:hypothetical protein